jgi:hypothetical protein
MPKINSVKMIPEDNLSKYDHILYGLNFMQEILEQEPDKCFVSDDTELWHFGIAPEILKHRLFYNYGYKLSEDTIETEKLSENSKQIVTGVRKSNNRIKLWQDLAAIDKNLKKHKPGDLYAFWAIPSLFCVSHSHPARDVFRVDSLARFIAASEYDVIIELLTKERNNEAANSGMFAEILKEFEWELERYEYVITNEKELDYQQIESIINQIDEFLAQGKRLLFHSQGRTDRLGLVLACWLVKHNLATQNNVIDKINQLREGVWANDDPTDRFQYWHFNKYQQENCDETRHFVKSKVPKVKARIMSVVPFYFNKKMRQEIPYWTNNLSLKVDYTVDEEIVKIIEKFIPKKGKKNDK